MEARRLGLTPLAIDALFLSTRLAGERNNQDLTVGAWLSAAIIRQNQEQNPPSPERLAAEVRDAERDEIERDLALQAGVWDV